MKRNKQSLLDYLSEKTGLPEKDLNSVLDSFFSYVTDSLTQGDEVLLSGFGKFEPRKKQERTVVNFHTKEKMLVPSYSYPHFKPSKNLKETVKSALSS